MLRSLILALLFGLVVGTLSTSVAANVKSAAALTFTVTAFVPPDTLAVCTALAWGAVLLIALPRGLGQLMLGLVNGSFYALLSLGLAVIFGLLDRATEAGFDAYLLPQADSLPMARRRVDLLFRRPG